MTHNRLTMQPYWHEVLIEAFRIPVRIAVRLRSTDLKTLRTLLEIALYRELQDAGHTQQRISLVLGCSLRTVKNIKRRSTDLNQKASFGSLDLLLKTLKERPLSPSDIRLLVPDSGDFARAEVALQLLLHLGYVEAHRKQNDIYYTATDIVKNTDIDQWSAPLGAAERAFVLRTTLMEALLDGPRDLQALVNYMKKMDFSRKTIQQTLQQLTEEGLIETEGAAPRQPPLYKLPKEGRQMIPQEEMDRLRIGLLHFLEKIRWSLDYMLKRDGLGLLGQRTFLFDASPDSLKTFIREHRAYVLERVKAMEHAARGHPSTTRCVMLWAISPRPGEEIPQGDA